MLALVPDPGTSLLFAALILFDGFRRRSTGDIVLRRIVLGPWHIPDAAPANGWRLVHWWPPAITSVLLPALSPEPIAPSALRLRVRLRVLAATGGLVTVGLIFGVPFLTTHFGVIGLLQSLAALLLLGIVTAVITHRSLLRLGLTSRATRRKCLPLISPFSAGRAAEVLLETALARRQRVTAMRTLLGADEFRRWIRPLAWDHLNVNDSALASVDPDRRVRVEAIVAAPPAGDYWNSYCPRCGDESVLTEGECPACGVTLRTANSERRV